MGIRGVDSCIERAFKKSHIKAVCIFVSALVRFSTKPHCKHLSSMLNNEPIMQTVCKHFCGVCIAVRQQHTHSTAVHPLNSNTPTQHQHTHSSATARASSGHSADCSASGHQRPSTLSTAAFSGDGELSTSPAVLAAWIDLAAAAMERVMSDPSDREAPCCPYCSVAVCVGGRWSPGMWAAATWALAPCTASCLCVCTWLVPVIK